MTNYSKKQIKGATMIEYVLIIGLIAAIAALSVTNVGTSVSTIFTNMVGTLKPAGG